MGRSDVDERRCIDTPSLVLVGLSGSGKSTLGRALAERLSWRLFDLDDEIVRRVSKPIPAIFAEEGEGFFRRIEGELLREALTMPRIVLATGGGAPCQPGAMEAILGSSTHVVWLDAPSELLASRLEDTRGRPLLEGVHILEGLRAQREEREVYYRQAHLRVEVGRRALPSLVEEVMAHIEVQGG